METTRTAKSTMNAEPGTVTYSCGKVSNNQHGLRIHQGKSGCQRARPRGQRLAGLASETQEYLSLDSNHSIEEPSVHETTQDVFQDPEVEEEDPLLDLLKSLGDSSQLAEQETVLDRPRQDSATSQRKPRIKWPKALDRKSWKLLDEELDIILEAAFQGPVNRKLQTLTTIVCSIAKERFGVEEVKVRREPPKLNRRQLRIENLSRELRQLKRRYRQSSPTERLGLSQLRNTVRTLLKSLRKAENTRKKARERTKKRLSFTANPYKFARKLLDKERSGTLETQWKR